MMKSHLHHHLHKKLNKNQHNKLLKPVLNIQHQSRAQQIQKSTSTKHHSSSKHTKIKNTSCPYRQTSNPIWEVIQNGNGPVSVTLDTTGQIKILPPKTAEEMVLRERERKARTTLLMAIPEDHLAKFHKMTDAKDMWIAIKSRFGGNDESKKMQKYILKQQFEGFTVSNSDGIHKGYERFQSLLSQLEIHGAGVSTEDANQKFLRSLPSAWLQVSLIMRNKPGMDSLSFDDLYNNLRVFENDVKGSTASSSNLQNIAFVSENTNSTNEVSTAYGVSHSSGHFDEYDLEEMDLKWQVAMISMRINKFQKKTGRKLQFDAKEPVGFDKTKVECFKCHKTGHFARECRTKEENRRRDGWNTGNREGRRTSNRDESITGKKEESRALVTVDGECVDWTTHSEDNDNYAFMANNSTGSDTQYESIVIMNDEIVSNNKDLDTPSFATKHVKTPAVLDCDYHVKLAKQVELHKQNMSKGNGSREKTNKNLRKPIWDNTQRVNKRQQFVTLAVQTRTGNNPVNTVKASGTNYVSTARQNINKQTVLTSTALKVNTVKPSVNDVRPQNAFNKTHSLPSRPLKGTTVLRTKLTNQKIYIAKVKAVSTVGEKWVIAVKSSDKLRENPHRTLKNKGIIDSGCSRHMTGNKTYLADYQDINGGPVAFGGSRGYITGKEFKNRDINEFCGLKGIKREYSNARTPQQNGVAERKNRTLIEAARTMLADSFLPNTFWAEAVSTACYVLNRVLVTKPHNKTPYELLTGKTPIISYIRPFGCHVTILNTIDHLGKFAGKSDEGFLVGYSLQSKAFRVYNLVTKRVEENLHIKFLENKPNVAGKGPNWLFDLDYLTDSMNYLSVSSENQANIHAGQQATNQNEGSKDKIDSGNSQIEDESAQDCFEVPYWHSYSSTNTSSSKSDEKRRSPREEEQVFLDDLARLQRQEKEANEEAEALIRNHDQDTEKSKQLPQAHTIGTASANEGLSSLTQPIRKKMTKGGVTPKTSHLTAVKRIFRYLKGKPKLGLWYPRESTFDLESYSDSDYAGANLEQEIPTTGRREYVAAASCCGASLNGFKNQNV
ncbi:ribonuclease H-like domain-containing protein [Tanacetum coccineum]